MNSEENDDTKPHVGDCKMVVNTDWVKIEQQDIQEYEFEAEDLRNAGQCYTEHSDWAQDDDYKMTYNTDWVKIEPNHSHRDKCESGIETVSSSWTVTSNPNGKKIATPDQLTFAIFPNDKNK